MTRARETSRLQVATNLDGVSGLDEFTVVDTSVKLIDSNLTLNAGFALPASTPVNTNGSTYIFLAIA